MSAPTKAALLACSALLASGCGAKLEIGRDCPAGGCDRAALGDAASACGAEFVVPMTTAVANEELYRCQLFTLDALRDAAGSDRAYITKAVATMVPYGHEIDVRLAPELADSADGPVDCGDILERPVRWIPLIQSLGESEDWDFVSAPFTTARSQRLLIAERFANLSADPIMVGLTLRLECADSAPARPSQTFEFVDLAPHAVGPAQQLSVTASCSFTRDVEVWRLFRPPQRISTFTAWRGGRMQPLWHPPNAEWSILLAPSLRLTADEGFEWQCGYENRGDTTFDVGGDSGYPCALMGIYQPIDDEDAEPLRCTH